MSVLTDLTTLRGNSSLCHGVLPVLQPLSELCELVIVGHEHILSVGDIGAALVSLASSLQHVTHATAAAAAGGGGAARREGSAPVITSNNDNSSSSSSRHAGVCN